MGLLAFPAFCVPILNSYGLLPFGLALGGLLSGIQAIKVVRSDPDTYSGMGLAIAGTVVSAIATLMAAGVALIMILGLGAATLSSF